MKHYLLVGICWCLLLTSEAQEPYYLDSLKRMAGQPLTDSSKIDVLNELSREYIYVSVPEALKYATEALTLSNQMGYIRGRGHAYRNFAAISSLQENFSLSIEFAQKAFSIFDTANDSLGIGNCYLTLGRTYGRAEDHAKSLEYQLKALQIFHRIKNTERIAVAKLNVSEAYFWLNKLDSAELLNTQAIAMLRELNDWSSIAPCYKIRGMIYLARGDIASAENFFLTVVDISKKLGDKAQKDPLIKSYLYLADIHKKSKRFKEQLAMLHLARESAISNDYPKELQQASRELSDYYTHERNFAEAHRYLLDYFQVSDSLSNRQRKDRLALTNTVFQSMKAQEEKEALEQDKALQAQTIERQQNQLTYTFIILLLLVIIISGLFFYMRFQRSVYKLLKQQKEEIDLKSEELKRINSTKDKFFSIVAHDLKAPLDSLLGFSKLITTQIEALSKEEIKEMGSGLQSTVSNTLKMAENLIAWSQSQMKANEFKPELVQVGKVIQQICAVYHPIGLRKNIFITYHLAEDLKVMADENQLIFIIRNLINNALKFTRSGGSIRCETERLADGYVRIAIRDTGVGIEESRLGELFTVGRKTNTPGTDGEKGTGLGLVLCKEFTEQNRGRLLVHSVKDEGSVFFIELPQAHYPI